MTPLLHKPHQTVVFFCLKWQILIIFRLFCFPPKCCTFCLFPYRMNQKWASSLKKVCFGFPLIFSRAKRVKRFRLRSLGDFSSYTSCIFNAFNCKSRSRTSVQVVVNSTESTACTLSTTTAILSSLRTINSLFDRILSKCYWRLIFKMDDGVVNGTFSSSIVLTVSRVEVYENYSSQKVNDL